MPFCHEDVISNGKLTKLFSYRLDLRNQRLVNEAAEAKGADVLDESKLKQLTAEVDGRQIELVQSPRVGDGEQCLEGLQLKDGVEVELLALEESLQSKDVEIVLLTELEEETEVQVVDLGQILNVNSLEAVQAVETTQINLDGTVLNLLGWSGKGDGGQSGGEDGGELHGNDHVLNAMSEFGTIKCIKRAQLCPALGSPSHRVDS